MTANEAWQEELDGLHGRLREEIESVKELETKVAELEQRIQNAKECLELVNEGQRPTLIQDALDYLGAE